MSVTSLIFEAFISPGPLTSKISFLLASELLFKANDFTFRTISFAYLYTFD